MSEPHITACLFDIGNVLLPFEYGRTRERLAPFCGIAPDDRIDAIGALTIEHECGRLPEEPFFEALAGLLEYRGERELLVDAWCDIFTINEPMVQFAERLIAADVPCYLLSNIGPAHAAFIDAQYPFIRRFHGRIYSFRVGAMKPDPRIYAVAAEQIGVDPARVLYIDDKPENVEGGRLAGFHSVGYDLTRHDLFIETLPTPLLQDPLRLS